MYIFGGNTRGKEAVNLNDVWRLDLTTGAWQEVPTTGGGQGKTYVCPCNIWSQNHLCPSNVCPGNHLSSPAWYRNIAQVGVQVGHFEWYQGSTAQLEEESDKRKNILTSGSDDWPAPRHDHSTVLVGDTMVVFGGNGVWRDNTLRTKSINAFALVCPHFLSPARNLPDALNAISSGPYRGGGRKDVAPLGDLHELNLVTRKWRFMQAAGPAPPPRFAHTVGRRRLTSA